jgi:hypothetical protein
MTPNRYESRKRPPRGNEPLLGVRPLFLIAAAVAVVILAWILFTVVLTGSR